jgi:hypothetical protein
MFLPVRAANEKADRLEKRMRTWRERAADQAEGLIEKGTTAVGGFALGAADARWGEDAVAGMSTSLAVGLVGSALEVLEVGGAMAKPFVKAIGNTGIAVYSYKSGFEMMRRRMTENP